MAESYDIHLTDPLSAAFKVRAFTSNGTIFPTSGNLNSTAVGAETSLLIFGKGHPEYGERINEDILHVLENFSGSTEPQNPVSGQLWYERFTVIRSPAVSGNFYIWIDGTGWAGFTPSLVTLPITDASVNDGDYWLDGSDLYLAVKDASHPLSPTWLPRVFEDRTVGVPTLNDFPRKVLKVYNGVEWKIVDSVHVSETAPPADTGDLWYDDTVPQLNIYNGTAFVSVADRYLQHDGSVAMTGDLIMDAGSPTGNQIKNLADPTDPQDAATRSWAEALTGSVPTTLAGLSDTNITGIADTHHLSYDFGTSKWVNGALALTDFGVSTLPASIDAALLGYVSGLTVQTQLNNITANYLPLIGGAITGLGTITLSVDPTLAFHAATKQYVDTAVTGSTLALEDLSDVVYSSGSPAIIPVTGQVLEYDGSNWINGDNIHTHASDTIAHISSQPYLRDLDPINYPDLILSDVIEKTTASVSSRLNVLDTVASREVFVTGGSPVETDFVLSDGRYAVGHNRLSVHVNGIKQYANQRARQSIQFNLGKNLSVTAPLGIAVGTYSLDVAIDGAPATNILFTLDSTSTIDTLISQINNSLLGGSPPIFPIGNAAWSNANTALYVFSNSTGAGSSVEITEGTGGSPLVQGVLTALTNVALGSPTDPNLPVLSYGIGSPAITVDVIQPAFPSNVTQVTADLAYEEVSNTFGTTGFGTISSTIRFNSTLTAGAVVEIISDVTNKRTLF